MTSAIRRIADKGNALVMWGRCHSERQPFDLFDRLTASKLRAARREPLGRAMSNVERRRIFQRDSVSPAGRPFAEFTLSEANVLRVTLGRQALSLT